MLRFLAFAWKKFRLFGFTGVLNYPGLLLARRRRKKMFMDMAKRSCGVPPKRGLTLVAAFSKNISLSKVMRDFLFSLHDAGIPFQALDWCDNDVKFQIEDNRLGKLLTPIEKIRICKYDHVVGMLSLPFDAKELGLVGANVAFWEFESGFPEVYPELSNGGVPVIGMSDFNVSYFKSCFASNTPVYKILYPFRPYCRDMLDAPSDVRRRYGIGEDEFVVFYNFDYISTYGRKNPEGALRAFAAAFRDEPNVRLVFKTMRASRSPEHVAYLRELADELGIADRYTTIDDFIPERDVYGLTNAADIYLALHRGEGFGLPVLEAMSLGKAVVVTGYSAVLEFCNADNSLLVPYKLMPYSGEKRDGDFYSHVKAWAEPDVEAASKSLRKLYEDKVFRERLGKNAQKFVADYFSIENFKKSVELFLDTK